MSPDTENKFIEGGDDSVSRYLKPDTSETKEMKSLQGMEYEYSDYLATIEYSIARYFYENDRKIKDKDAVAALTLYLFIYTFITSFAASNVTVFGYESSITENLR